MEEAVGGLFEKELRLWEKKETNKEKNNVYVFNPILHVGGLGKAFNHVKIGSNIS